MAYTFTWETKGVYKYFSGVLTAAEYHRSQVELTGDARFDSTRYVINDFSAIERFVITPEEAEYMAAYSQGPHMANPTLRVCFITTAPSVLALISGSRDISIFKLEAFPTLAAARESLSQGRKPVMASA
ncbi:hypothetical protein [Ferribacterium limneticum]|uniref:hypothetical protein n=1 Tax=Ferribacterium limneticum TaxID=76259 RepID=UPI001CF9A6A4|nr:hypothetical protein [Ferribacterium limneticum]UCV27930.1 hypothetical protein KI617_17045 [Ferribacterium limneticum]UCV31847.1 hypothetical protein KI608_17045 [Ferribacterium limneticum]